MESKSIYNYDAGSSLAFAPTGTGPVMVPSMVWPGYYFIPCPPPSTATSTPRTPQSSYDSHTRSNFNGDVEPQSKRRKNEASTEKSDILEDTIREIGLDLSAAVDDIADDFLHQEHDFSDSKRELPLEHSFLESDLQDDSYTLPTTSRSQPLLSDFDADDDDDYRYDEPLFSILSPPRESRLAANPFFDDLKTTLAEEFKGNTLPTALLSLLPKRLDIPTREQKLHTRFNKLSDIYPDAVHQLSGFYKYQTALIETERFRTLDNRSHSKPLVDMVNSQFNDSIHAIIDRVERSVLLLEEADLRTKKTSHKSRPLLSRAAIKLMSDWYDTHLEHPYPTPDEVAWLAREGQISTDQVKKWFANKRNRSCNTKRLSDIANRKRKLSLVD